jgi:phytol kinase
MNNWLGLLICIIYIFGMIGLAEGLRRWRGYSSDFTRKVIHIGVGMMSWGLHFLFDTPWFFVIACGGFMVINFLDWRYGFFAAMASGDRSNLGTVYFPLAQDWQTTAHRKDCSRSVKGVHGRKRQPMQRGTS